MKEGRKVYLRTLGLLASNKKDERKAALERAHAIREFEIELYWKRANYFWLLQAAVFAAVGLTWRIGGTSLPEIVPLALASLGAVTACAGWLATLGSKFWQRNWEHHIDMLEGEFEGNLYKTVYVSRSGSSWSLTGISEALALCFTLFWIAIIVVASSALNPTWSLNFNDLTWHLTGREAQTLLCIAFAILGMLLLLKRKSGVKGDRLSYPDEMNFGGDPLPEPKLRRNRSAKVFLVRREPSI